MKSWDCFDTLITRRFFHPYSIHDETGKKLGIAHWRKIRLKAEKGTDGTIQEIYKNLPGINPDVEFQTEIEHCYGIVEMINKVSDGDLIISDMYFTEDQIKKLLINCGLKKEVKIIVTPAGKKYGTVWSTIPELNQIQLHTGDNLRSDVESPSKYGIKSEHYLGFQFNKIEEYVSEYDFHLACWMRYIRFQCPYTDERNKNLWSDQSNFNIPALALASLELPTNTKVAFSYRDCAYWHKIYESLTGRTGIRLDVSRNCYNKPSNKFNEYVKNSTNNSLIVDMHGTGNSIKKFYSQDQDILYLIGRPEMFPFKFLIQDMPNAIERHNCTDIGPLLDWDDSGPVRGDCEHDLNVAALQSKVIKIACDSIKFFNIQKNKELLNFLLRGMVKNYTHTNVRYVKG